MARPLPLPFFPEELPPQAPLPAAPPRPQLLWMAVHFPHLGLETLHISPSSPSLFALITHAGRNGLILDCTAGAQALGVAPNQTLSAAEVLAPLLQSRPRDAHRELRALQKLAGLGQHFTPTVSLELPDSLLLEVAGSAHLFGGIEAIRDRAREFFAAQGFTARVALAPTPLAGLWFAAAGCELGVTEPAALRGALGSLPVRSLAWPREIAEHFPRLGIKRLADLLRLPRDGLAKRFGADFLRLLDRALGASPDPRSCWQAPRRCRVSRELPGELEELELLRPHLDNLVAELCRVLQSHDAGVERLKLLFRHWRRAPTMVSVGSALACRDAARWNALIEAELMHCRLAAPVLAVEIQSGALRPFVAASRDLPGERARRGETLTELIALLRARLGRQQVFGLGVTADARPEQAACVLEPGEHSPKLRRSAPRPAQLLREPRLLAGKDHRPCYRGAALKLLCGPERIEGGWWCGEDWIRDYYQAVSDRGEFLWIFRERGRWYLHGLFS